MGDGTFMCSLYHSANVLSNSPVYSSSQSTLPHVSVYHPTFLPDGICVLWFNKNVLDSPASLEVHLYAMFAADVIAAFP